MNRSSVSERLDGSSETGSNWALRAVIALRWYWVRQVGRVRRVSRVRRVGENEDVGPAKIVERRKAPYLQQGFSFYWDRSPFSVAGGSYSGRTGRCNEMTETNAGRICKDVACPVGITSGGHSKLGLMGRPGRHPISPQDSVSALSTGPGLSRC